MGDLLMQVIMNHINGLINYKLKKHEKIQITGIKIGYTSIMIPETELNRAKLIGWCKSFNWLKKYGLDHDEVSTEKELKIALARYSKILCISIYFVK